MKNLIKPSRLPVFTLIAGILGLLLRSWLFLTGIDEKGLLVSRHPGAVLTWILTVLFVGVLFLSTRNPGRPKNASPSRSRSGFAGALIAGIGIAVTELAALAAHGDVFSLISGILGVAAAVCLGIASWCHWKGTLPAFGVYPVVVVYFLFHLVCQYRQWSWASQPQLYAFPLLSCVLLMLSAYHRAALFTSMGSPGSYLFFTQAAAFFCFLSIPGGNGIFYLTTAIWMLLSPFSVGVSAWKKEE